MGGGLEVRREAILRDPASEEDLCARRWHRGDGKGVGLASGDGNTTSKAFGQGRDVPQTAVEVATAHPLLLQEIHHGTSPRFSVHGRTNWKARGKTASWEPN